MTTQEDHATSAPAREVGVALWRGSRLRCPACGRGRLFRSYLKVAESCASCGEALHHQRADDAPAYFVILIVGHVVAGLALTVETAYKPEMWVHWVLWLPLALAMTLTGLPMVKGALVGLQWALRMHGFASDAGASEIATSETTATARSKA